MVNEKDNNRFDYNQLDKIEFRKELEKKKTELLNRGRPEISVLPSISWNNVLTVFVALFSIAFLWFGYYPEPPSSPILFQWQSMGHKLVYKGNEIFYIDNLNNNISLSRRENLLILHGFPTSSFDYHLMYPNLTKVFHRIIAPDFIGFGFSSKPRSYSYSIMDQADLVVNLLARLHIDNVHLYTHDYGNSVAQELLARKSEGKLGFELKSVCMMNGGIFPSVHTPTLSQRLLRVPIIRTLLAKFSNFKIFSWSLNSVFGPHTQATYSELQDFWKIIRINDGYRVWPELLTYIDERFANEQRWVEALRTTVPFLFIYGPADPVNPSPLFEQTFNEKVGSHHLSVLPTHIGHYPHLEDFNTVFKSYINFLEPILKK